MAGKQKGLALALVTIAAGLLAWFALRNVIAASITAIIAGVSASALAAGSAKAGAAAGVHIPAAVGALAGAVLLAVELRDRPWPERCALTLASYVAAYYGAQAAAESWSLDNGWVGIGGVVCARLGVSVLDTAQRLVRDAEFVKGLLARRSGGQ